MMGLESEAESVNNSEESSHLWYFRSSFWLNIRSTILKEVATARIGKLPHNKGLVVLGDYGSGKSTLACRLSHKNVPPKSPAIEYHYVDIRDEATDGNMRLFYYYFC